MIEEEMEEQQRALNQLEDCSKKPDHDSLIA